MNGFLGADGYCMSDLESDPESESFDSSRFSADAAENWERGLRLTRTVVDSGLFNHPLLVDRCFGSEPVFRSLLYRTHRNHLVQISPATKLYDSNRKVQCADEIAWHASSLGRDSFHKHRLGQTDFGSVEVFDEQSDLLYPARLLWTRVPLAAGHPSSYWLFGGPQRESQVIMLEHALRRVRPTRECEQGHAWTDYAGRSFAGWSNHINLCAIADAYRLLRSLNGARQLHKQRTSPTPGSSASVLSGSFGSVVELPHDR